MSMGLNSARALIIDDRVDEITPLIEALGQLNIGVSYLNGRLEEIGSPREGVRLAFVDMNLEADEGASDEEIAQQAALTLNKSVGEQQTVMAVIAWTKNGGLATLFEGYLVEICPNIVVVNFQSHEKPEQGDGDAARTKVGEILESIEKTLDDNPSYKILWNWEQGIHAAATNTTASFLDIIAGDENPDKAAMCALASLTIAAQESPPDTEQRVGFALTSALLPILTDKAEYSGRASLGDTGGALKELWEAVKEEKRIRKSSVEVSGEKRRAVRIREAISGADLDNLRLVSDNGENLDTDSKIALLTNLFPVPDGTPKSNLTNERTAKLNSMLHISYPPETGWNLLPGNVYPWNAKMHEWIKISEKAIERQQNEVLDQLGLPKELNNKLILPIVIELSPPCDVAQGKLGTPSLVCGAIVADCRCENARWNAKYLKAYGPIYFDDGKCPGGLSSGSHYLFLNAKQKRHANKKNFNRFKPLFRLRSSTITDAQFWLANYSCRPGIVSVGS